MPAGDYKATHSFEERRKEVDKVKQRSPDQVPVICERAEKSSLPDLPRSKFLVPSDTTVGMVIASIRKKITLDAEQSIFVYVSDTVPSNSTLIRDLYDKFKEEDGFLYVTYSAENTYGSLM